MEEISRKIKELLEAIHQTDIYQDYLEQEKVMSQNPELRERLRKFRGDNFQVQNQHQHAVSLGRAGFEQGRSDLPEAVQQLYKESRELRSIEECNAYLDAELAVCKLMQTIACELCDGIGIDVPEYL